MNNLTTTSGDITKVSDVITTSTKTNDIYVLYTFSFKINHNVPVGGYFSIILTNDSYNGATITDALTV